MGMLTRMQAKSVGLKPEYLTAPTVQVPKWEYAFVQYALGGADRDTVQDQINLMGSYGWELCVRHDEGVGGTRAKMDYLVLFFKRRCA